MGTINLDNVKPGMVLAKEARDMNGRILLAAGTELTEKHLRVFRIWGVSEVDVQGIEHQDVVAEATAHVEPTSLRDAEEKAAQLFALTERSHPAIAELTRLTVQRFLRPDSGRAEEHE